MGNKVQIWHNTRCSKSRNAFQWLQEKKLEIEWVDYMKQPFSKVELASVLKKLNISAFELIRKGESLFKEKYAGEKKTEEEWIQIMCDHPNLIERPIIVHGERAVIARPIEKLDDLF